MAQFIISTRGAVYLIANAWQRSFRHLDAQAGPSATKHLDVLAYNVLLHRTYRVPVHSGVLNFFEEFP